LGAILLKNYASLLQSRYQIKNMNIDAIELLEEIVRKKGVTLKNHSVDTERVLQPFLMIIYKVC